jgi:hypothetical protein
MFDIHVLFTYVLPSFISKVSNTNPYISQGIFRRSILGIDGGRVVVDDMVAIIPITSSMIII